MLGIEEYTVEQAGVELVKDRRNWKGTGSPAHQNF